MALHLHNTRTRSKDLFKPLQEGVVHMYNCGPTVYNFAHIGNFRAFMSSDVLKRYLLYKGYKVVQVMNITDVDDKIIRDSKKEGTPWKEFTERYTTAFMDDLKTLHILPAEHYPKATEHIPHMVDLVKKLLEKGIAYKAEDGIYFSVHKFHHYGDLSGIKLDKTQSGKRVLKDEYNKEEVHDFALWKYWTEEDGDVFWETELGKGRPGWHIECSAMSMRWLGEQFDIHTGGIDLIFPHHENEIAQTEAVTGKRFVEFWLHNDYILVDGKKMSKSLGNFYTLRDLLEKGYKPGAIRYVLLSSNYRQQLNFTLEGLDGAAQAVRKYQEFFERMEAITEAVEVNTDIDLLIADAREQFEKGMDNDLEISPALGAVFDFMHAVNKLHMEKPLGKEDAQKVLVFMQKIDSVLGLLGEREEIPSDVLYLAQQREEARKAKNWEESDKIRDALKEKGYRVDDTKDGFVVRKL